MRSRRASHRRRAPQRRRRNPLPPYPDAIEREFAAFLRSFAAKAIALSKEALRRPLADLAEEQRRQDDAALDAAGALLRARVEFMRWIETVEIEGRLVQIGEQLDLFSAQAIKRQLPAVVPLDVIRAAGLTQETVSGFARQGVDLIKTIGSEHFDRIEQRVVEAFRAGRRAESLAKELLEIEGVTKRRAEFIARDQIGKLNAKIQQERQQALGAETYIWRTSKDSRVRESHRALDGTTHRWDNPPIVDEKTGRRAHPGEDFQCRCRAEMDVDAVLAALEAEDVPPAAVPAEVMLPLAAQPEPMAAIQPAVMQFVEAPLGLPRPLANV